MGSFFLSCRLLRSPIDTVQRLYVISIDHGYSQNLMDLKTIHISDMKHGEIKLVPPWNHQSAMSFHCAGRPYVDFQKRKVIINLTQFCIL